MKKLENEIKNVPLADLEKMGPKALSKDFFNTNKKLYENNEMVMQAMGVSAIKHSVESVLELFVSVFESHFDARRNMDEDSTVEEFTIVVNGPKTARADSLIDEAMRNYWKSKGSS